jgi:hypothetical protein
MDPTEKKTLLQGLFPEKYWEGIMVFSPLSGGGKNLEIVPEYKYQIPFFVQGIAYIYESIL